MKSIKRGRGPSMMSGIASVIMGIFGIVWTVIAAQIGGAFDIFGGIFILASIVTAVYNFRNATGKNRYSVYDITDDTEESDPLNEIFGENSRDIEQISDYSDDAQSIYCPYCGVKVEDDFEFCNKCGKKLP